MTKDKSFLDSLIVSSETIENINNVSKLFGKRSYYIENFKSEYLEHLKNEYNLIHFYFPEVDITPEARIKSFKSYSDKVQKVMGSSKDIYDIFGNRYIINSVSGSFDDKNIIPTLYAIRDFLAYFFTDVSLLPERVKDYVSHPKHSSYQSLHITRYHISKYREISIRNSTT